MAFFATDDTDSHGSILEFLLLEKIITRMQRSCKSVKIRGIRGKEFLAWGWCHRPKANKSSYLEKIKTRERSITSTHKIR
jgi:hypothetical protein